MKLDQLLEQHTQMAYRQTQMQQQLEDHSVRLDEQTDLVVQMQGNTGDAGVRPLGQ